MQMMIWTTTDHKNERSERLGHGSSVKKWKQTINYLHWKDSMFIQMTWGFDFELLTALWHPITVSAACNRSLWLEESRTHTHKHITLQLCREHYLVLIGRIHWNTLLIWGFFQDVTGRGKCEYLEWNVDKETLLTATEKKKS